ncbi:amino acid transporter [Apiospora phragmitis]|uniref:Amino acid transporter n=1 Tax=Apiospora phragmitis TaxID=2905665 RepID=A0ABR1WUD1_9PEZI
MVSMAPTAGGQYHWISEFAPESAQKFLSYTMGWLSVLAWQSSTAAGCFLAATEFQGVVVLNYPDYVFQNWHGTLIAILIVILLVVLNTIGVRLLPWLETCAFVLHMAGFFAFIIPVWFMGPKPSPSTDVFTQFTNQGGWHSTGLSVLIGMITPVTALIGSNSAVHLSEELRNASKSLPRVMMATIVLNGGLGFVTMLQHGDRVPAALRLRAGQRDPLPPRLRPRAGPGRVREIPANAVLFTGAVSSLLSVINVGSTIAYNQLTSMGIAALLSSYLVSTSCMALRRVRGRPLLPAHFTLGRAGLVINLVAMGFLLLALIMSFFPPLARPAPDTMNWAILVYSGVVAASLAYYIPVGRHHYKGPVVYVRQEV